MTVCDCKLINGRVSLVYRDETPEEIAERERLEAEMPKPQLAHEPPKDVCIAREDFDLLDVQEDNAVYHIYEEDGSITTIKGVN